MSQSLYVGEGRFIRIRIMKVRLCMKGCQIFVTGVGLFLMMIKTVLFGYEIRILCQ